MLELSAQKLLEHVGCLPDTQLGARSLLRLRLPRDGHLAVPTEHHLKPGFLQNGGQPPWPVAERLEANSPSILRPVHMKAMDVM